MSSFALIKVCSGFKVFLEALKSNNILIVRLIYIVTGLL